jgi:hypothetical protein
VRFSAKAEYGFVPAFGGNRELPEAERVSMVIVRPKVEERDGLYSLDVERDIAAAGDGDRKRGKPGVTFKRRRDLSRILRNHVGIIKNLEAEGEDGKARVWPVRKPALHDHHGSTAHASADRDCERCREWSIRLLSRCSTERTRSMREDRAEMHSLSIEVGRQSRICDSEARGRGGIGGICGSEDEALISRSRSAMELRY